MFVNYLKNVWVWWVSTPNFDWWICFVQDSNCQSRACKKNVFGWLSVCFQMSSSTSLIWSVLGLSIKWIAWLYVTFLSLIMILMVSLQVKRLCQNRRLATKTGCTPVDGLSWLRPPARLPIWWSQLQEDCHHLVYKCLLWQSPWIRCKQKSGHIGSLNFWF